MAEPGDTEDTYKDGSQMLVQLDADEVASVEYWLYLEGCDGNSVPIRSRTELPKYSLHLQALIWRKENSHEA